MFGYKAALEAKDEQIKSLKEEIKWLRGMVQPEAQPGSYYTNIEANAVLNPSTEEQLSQDEIEEQRKIDEEAYKILSGTY